jgi:hypothetical protein
MSPDVAPVCLPGEDAFELGELLEFLGCWFAQARNLLDGTLADHTANAYLLEELEADVARFVLLLHGNHDEWLVPGDER